MLPRATAVRPAGSWPAAEQRATVTLDYDGRHRRRVRLVADDRSAFLLDLPRAERLAEGDGLALAGGGYVRVVAAAEEVADLHCPTPEDAARVAWCIGNRHAPLQVLAGGALRIRDDHVLTDLAARLGARVARRRAPFAPEPGAYAAAGPRHGH